MKSKSKPSSPWVWLIGPSENHSGACLKTLMRALAPSEEGARFPISMVSSGVWAGKISLDKAHSLQEVGDGKKTMKQELERIGYLGATESNFNKIPIAVSTMTCVSFHRLKADYNGRLTLNCTSVLSKFLYISLANFLNNTTQISAALIPHISL